MKKYYFFSLVAILAIYITSCNDPADEMNDYIIAGVVNDDENVFINHDISMFMLTQEDEIVLLDLNQDGVSDLKLSREFHQIDTLKKVTTNLIALENTEIAYSVLPENDGENLLQYFVYLESEITLSDLNPMALSVGENIDSELDWQAPGFEILLSDMESIHYMDADSNQHSIYDSNLGGPFEYCYIPVRISADGNTYYAWVKYKSGNSEETFTNNSIAIIESSACTKLY